MAGFSRMSRELSEAARQSTVRPPSPTVVPRAGYVPGIPIGGSTPSNPGSATTSGAMDRQSWLDQLFQAYLACPWVADCIDVIAHTVTAGGIQAVPNSLSLEGDEDRPEPPPEVKSVQNLLEFVNPQDDIRQLIREVITDLLIFGDSFTEVTYLDTIPVGLYTLDPRTMQVLADEHGKVLGYFQQMPNGRSAQFLPHQVVHVKLDAPGGGIYGVSPTQKNYVPITNWLFTAGLVQETMRRGDPPRLWTDWPIALPQSEQTRLQQQYLIRNLGAKNIGNIYETKGGAQVHELGVNKIQEWLLTKTQCRDEIISGFNVPPSKVGVIESANIGGGQGTSQDRTFRVNNCGPLGELVLEKFSFRLLYLAHGISDWHLKFGEVDWRDDITIEQIHDMRVRNGSWTINRLRTDIGEPSIKGGNVSVIVDRQNLTAWEDMGDLSKANLQAIQVKGALPPAGGAPAAAGLSPVAPAPGNSEESLADFVSGGRYMTPYMEERETERLKTLWAEHRLQALQDLQELA